MWRSTGPLTSGGLTNDATPVLSGTAEAGATVTIYDSTRCWAPRWRMRTDTGASLRIRWARGAPPQHHGDRCGGNTSGHSPDFVLTVDTTVAPVSDLQVTDDVAQHTGPLTSGGLTNDATPALSGTAEAGATVTTTAARCWAPRWRMRTALALHSGSAGRGSTASAPR